MERYLQAIGPVLTGIQQTPSLSNFSPFPAVYNDLVAETVTTADFYNIKIRCCSSIGIGKQIKCSGYFCAGNKELALFNNDRDTTTWMRTVLQGSCHMDQWLEDKELWNSNIKGVGIYYDFLENKTDLSPSEVDNCMQNVINLELDCQNRSIEKIKKYNLPVDLKKFKEKAKEHLYRIVYCAEKRQWYNRQPLIALGVSLSQFSSSSYTALPEQLHRAFENYATLENFFRLKC